MAAANLFEMDGGMTRAKQKTIDLALTERHEKLPLRAGRKSEGKIRFTLTLDPKLEIEARKLDSNFSRFMEQAGWREVKRLKRSGHKRDMEF